MKHHTAASNTIMSIKENHKLYLRVFTVLLLIELCIMTLLNLLNISNAFFTLTIIDATLLSLIATPFITSIIHRYISFNNELSILIESSQAISETLDFNIVLQTVIDNATNLLELHTGALYMVEEDRLYLAATTPALPPDFPEQLRLGNVNDHPHLKQSITAKKPIALSDVTKVELSPAEEAVITQRNLSSLLFLPLIIKDEAAGVLILGTSGKPRTFTDSEIILYRALTNQAALAVSNARLFHQIQTHAEELEQQVNIRTEELKKTNIALEEEIHEHEDTEAELIEARNSAQLANRLKSAFLANMSHEIRTPMNAILGMTDLMLNTRVDNKQQNFLKKIKYSAENLLNIINDILDLSKIESGNLDIEHVDFSLKEVIENIETIASIKAQTSAINLIINNDDNIPQYLIGDPLRLSQVLINLTGNALKFCSTGDTVTLTVKQISRSDQRIKLQFDVSDTGIGISEQQQKLLFKAFSQADISTSRKYGGTGLGLTISRQLIELMEGEIWVQSELNKGSTFSFTISLLVQDNPTTINLKQTTGSHESKQAIEALRGARILVVEDNSINQELTLELLHGNGMYAQAVDNGAEALKVLEEENFDGILMDCQMPVMDGSEATQHIRANAELKDLPIIAMTASAMASDRQLALESGMDDYITKPIDTADMFTTMANRIKPSHIPGEQVQSPSDQVVSTQAEEKPKQIYTNEPIVDDIYHLSGIDSTQGLKTTNGNPVFYRKMLLKFAKNKVDFEQELRQAFSTNSPDTPERIVHNLKGVASNLGMTDLTRACTELEQSCSDRSTIPEDLLQNVVKELNKVLNGLSTLD